MGLSCHAGGDEPASWGPRWVDPTDLPPCNSHWHAGGCDGTGFHLSSGANDCPGYEVRFRSLRVLLLVFGRFLVWRNWMILVCKMYVFRWSRFSFGNQYLFYLVPFLATYPIL